MRWKNDQTNPELAAKVHIKWAISPWKIIRVDGEAKSAKLPATEGSAFFNLPGRMTSGGGCAMLCLCNLHRAEGGGRAGAAGSELVGPSIQSALISDDMFWAHLSSDRFVLSGHRRRSNPLLIRRHCRRPGGQQGAHLAHEQLQRHTNPND